MIDDSLEFVWWLLLVATALVLMDLLYHYEDE